ncbi:hypothetical protein [Burkholderia sp. Ac-20379]|uniref:hypothetical protein n=1 Tax=Burkholderia sp. Ac-20379 TaxID=2703900 RepID=UPI00197E162D|nr:hypothetical protein [Burkholderia sp. Ac-20379]MBN3726584.1 hypothetical protein [Burkholderia sp. Ac-20379]
MLRPLSSLAALLAFSALSTGVHADTSYFHKTLEGHIGGRYAFTMDLKNLDGTLSGNYHYAGKQNNLYLNGKIDAAGKLTLDETPSSGKRSGTFTGTLTGGTFDGTWTSADGAHRLPVDAHQTAEVVIGSKRELLTQAVGAYPLDTVSGSGGANSMWDTWRTKGGWTSNVSGIENAQRAFSTIKLTPAERRRLDSMTITVDAALTTRLNVDGKTVLSIPYRDAGMQYEIGKPHDGTAADDLKGLSPATTVRDEHLYLLASDHPGWLPALSGSFNAYTDDVALATVNYDVVGKTFQVFLRDSLCCGGTAFTFARQPH